MFYIHHTSVIGYISSEGKNVLPTSNFPLLVIQNNLEIMQKGNQTYSL